MDLPDVVVLDGELIEPICRRNPVPPWVVHDSNHIERFDQDGWSWSMAEDRSWTMIGGIVEQSVEVLRQQYVARW